MDFGVLGLDHGLGVSSSSETGFTSHIVSSSSDLETKQNRTLYGSGFCSKQERSESINTALDDYWLRSCKLSKSNSDADFSASKAMLQQRNSALLRSNSTSLSFLDTTGHPQHQMLSFSSPKPEPFSVDKASQNVATLPYFPNALSAYNARNFTGFNTGSLVSGVNMHGERGPFTPSQWIELEQQALIFKYLTANVPIPSNLLVPIRKAFDSVAFSSLPTGLLRPNSLGWGAFHLGFANNSDPEPGRCRRTDGKKWRCSRDAVPDQKYCERHMNRGRHRSRKPVEGQTGHSLAAASTTTTTTSSSTVASLGGAASNSLGASNSSAATMHMNRIQSSHGGLSLLSSSRSDQLGLVNSESQHSLRQFFDLPSKAAKPNNNQTTVPNWPESDRTQLSMSISGMSSSDANLEQNNASADRRHHQRQALNLIPISWEPSLGGPLGEVLHHTNNNSNINNNVDSGNSKRPLSTSSVLNLMTEGWDSSPPIGSSPTGVLQKTAFGALSNSSTGSSPRADNINKDLLASAHLNSSSSL